MDENKKLNILKDRKLDRQAKIANFKTYQPEISAEPEKNKSKGLKKGKGATLCSNLC